MMTKTEILDLYFADARSKLIDLAAFLDRIERSSGAGEHDPRVRSFRAALSHLQGGEAEKAKAVLLTLSDPTTEPVAVPTTKGATGAWPHYPS